MMLYKYRHLRNPEHAIDILLNQRLFCSLYKDLNDPFEGLFQATMHIPPRQSLLFGLGGRRMQVRRSIDDLLDPDKSSTRVCSLSASLSDVRLWSHYADGHRGIAIEIDVSGLEGRFCEVRYSEQLPQFGFSLLTSPTVEEVLTRKTVHWAYEVEYRLISQAEYFHVVDRIKTVYLGSRISKLHEELLMRVCPSNTEIVRTEIDPYRVEVKPLRRGDPITMDVWPTGSATK
jgi:hypothetical protein